MTQDKDRIFISKSTKVPTDAEWQAEADSRGKRDCRFQITINIWPWLCKLFRIKKG
jgi:hypothetical protein